MGKETRLAKNTIILTFSKICTQFINFILLPVYTSLLSTKEFGIVDLLNTYVSLLVPIITLQLEHALFRFLIDVRNNDKEKEEYLTTVLFSILIQSVIYLTLFKILGGFFNNNYKYFLVTNVIAYMFSSIMLQAARGLGDNGIYAVGSVITAISTVLLNIIFIAILNLGATGMLMASLISNIFSVLFIFIKKKIYIFLRFQAFKIDKLKTLLKYSAPLIPNALSWWIINVSDRTIITTLISVSANGIYATSNKFSGVFINFYNVFNLAWTESASVHIDDEDRDVFFSNIIDTMFKFFSSICFCIIAFLPFVFSWLVNDNYSEAYYHIPILLLGSLFNVVVGLYSVIYIAKKQTKKVANTSIIAGIINITCNSIFIKQIGLYAASISTMISFFVLMIFRYFDVQKYANVRMNKKIILFSILMLILLFITYYRRQLIYNIIALILTITYSIIVNRKMINELIKFIKIRIK